MSIVSGSTPSWHGTTIVSVRDHNEVVIAGDGQVSMGSLVVKTNARKVRMLRPDKPGQQVLVGFAGATADAFALMERLEEKLDKHTQLLRACVQLAKDWRTDRYLRRLEAMMVVADSQYSLLLTGSGDVLEPEDAIISVGSGGPYALAAARALKKETPLGAQDVARKALEIAAGICVYTNQSILVERILLSDFQGESSPKSGDM
jgi:ATP-dependent HslUV protease subunit HslV